MKEKTDVKISSICVFTHSQLLIIFVKVNEVRNKIETKLVREVPISTKVFRK